MSPIVACTIPKVNISTSLKKTFFNKQDWLQFFYNLNSLKKFHLPNNFYH